MLNSYEMDMRSLKIEIPIQIHVAALLSSYLLSYVYS